MSKHQGQGAAGTRDLTVCNAMPNQTRHRLVNITNMQNKTVILVFIFT
jgi:hypothetical protein